MAHALSARNRAHAVLSLTHPVQSLFAVRVIGDSMLPDFQEGDTAVCNPNLKPRNRDYVLARCGDSILLRQYRTHFTGARLETPNGDRLPIPVRRGVARIVAVVIERSRVYRYPEPSTPAERAANAGGAR